MNIYGSEEELSKEFSEQYFTLEEAQKSHPAFRYRSILYSIDYLVNGETYSMVVFPGGTNALTFFPDDIKNLKQSEWHGVVANFLKFEDGNWKGHYSSSKPFPAMKAFSDLDRLRAVMEAGYAYHSIDHAGIWPFDPPDVLRNDSVRDRRLSETVFRYPVKKPNVPPPDVPSAVESADPHSEAEGAKSAPWIRTA